MGGLANDRFCRRAVQSDGLKKLSADPRIRQIGGLREYKPDAVVFWVLGAVAQHEHDLVANVNCETGKHGPYFGLERS